MTFSVDMLNPFSKSIKYFVKFVRKTPSGYEQIKQKRVKLDNNTVQFKDKTYIVDFTQPSITISNKRYIFVDIDSGQLSIHTVFVQSHLNSSLIDMILNTKIVRDLAHRLQPINQQPIFNIIVYICLGIAVGYIIGNLFSFDLIESYLSSGGGGAGAVQPKVPSGGLLP